MDFVKNLTGGSKQGEQAQQQQQQSQQQKSGGGGFMDKLNNAAGGGAAGEKKEDGLDKGVSSLIKYSLQFRPCISLTSLRYTGVDWVQEHVLGQGDQSNESAFEQAKDEQISGMFTLTKMR